MGDLIVYVKNLGAAILVILLVAVATPQSASAATIAFTCLTDNSGSCATFATTLDGTVTATATGFEVTVDNGGLGDGVITIVAVNAPGTGTGYSLTGLIEDPPDVDFAIDGTGLPGSGQNLGAGFTSEFSASALPPPVDNGAGGGESIGLVFTLTTPLSQGDLDALIASGELQFGLHVQSLGEGEDSEKFINTPPTNSTPVPEPASMFLLGTGLLVAARARRRKN